MAYVTRMRVEQPTDFFHENQLRPMKQFSRIYWGQPVEPDFRTNFGEAYGPKIEQNVDVFGRAADIVAEVFPSALLLAGRAKLIARARHSDTGYAVVDMGAQKPPVFIHAESIVLNDGIFPEEDLGYYPDGSPQILQELAKRHDVVRASIYTDQAEPAATQRARYLSSWMLACPDSDGVIIVKPEPILDIEDNEAIQTNHIDTGVEITHRYIDMRNANKEAYTLTGYAQGSHTESTDPLGTQSFMKKVNRLSLPVGRSIATHGTRSGNQVSIVRVTNAIPLQ